MPSIKTRFGLTLLATLLSSGAAFAQIKIAYIDPLTHLPNRRFFLDEAERLAGRGALGMARACVLMIDLDHFLLPNRVLYPTGIAMTALFVLAAASAPAADPPPVWRCIARQTVAAYRRSADHDSRSARCDWLGPERDLQRPAPSARLGTNPQSVEAGAHRPVRADWCRARSAAEGRQAAQSTRRSEREARHEPRAIAARAD